MSRRSRPRTYPARIVCSECGSAQTIQRSRERQRGAGHIKDIYCANCNKVTPHVERGPHENDQLGDERLPILLGDLQAALVRGDVPEVKRIAQTIAEAAGEESA